MLSFRISVPMRPRAGSMCSLLVFFLGERVRTFTDRYSPNNHIELAEDFC